MALCGIPGARHHSRPHVTRGPAPPAVTRLPAARWRSRAAPPGFAPRLRCRGRRGCRRRAWHWVMEGPRQCARCGGLFEPRRDHARFSACRVAGGVAPGVDVGAGACPGGRAGPAGQGVGDEPLLAVPGAAGRAAGRPGHRGGSRVLAGVRPAVQAVLDRTGTSALLVLYPTVDAAREAVLDRVAAELDATIICAYQWPLSPLAIEAALAVHPVLRGHDDDPRFRLPCQRLRVMAAFRGGRLHPQPGVRGRPGSGGEPGHLRSSTWTCPAAWTACSPSASPAARASTNSAGGGPRESPAPAPPHRQWPAAAGPSGSASTTGAVNIPPTVRTAATSRANRAWNPRSAASSGRITSAATSRPPGDRARLTCLMPPQGHGIVARCRSFRVRAGQRGPGVHLYRVFDRERRPI